MSGPNNLTRVRFVGDQVLPAEATKIPMAPVATPKEVRPGPAKTAEELRAPEVPPAPEKVKPPKFVAPPKAKSKPAPVKAPTKEKSDVS